MNCVDSHSRYVPTIHRAAASNTGTFACGIEKARKIIEKIPLAAACISSVSDCLTHGKHTKKGCDDAASNTNFWPLRGETKDVLDDAAMKLRDETSSAKRRMRLQRREFA